MFRNILIILLKFSLLLSITLTVFLSLNIEKIQSFLDIDKNFILWFIILFQFLFFLLFLKKIYEIPIKNLEIWIKYFLLWDSQKSDNFMKKTLNPHINYITLFLKRVNISLKDIKDEFIHWKQIKWEVWLAKEIQGKMLWKKLLEVPSLNIVMNSKPAWELGWDSYDIIKSEDSENYYIYVWDATWHWVWAWFIMTMVNALIEWFIKSNKSWAHILAKTNQVLKPRLKSNLLMSLLLVRWDEENKRLFMTWAGHEYLLIYKQNLNKTFMIKSWWVALWMVKNISKILKEVEIKIDPGDIIVLYSDWITEAINRPKRDWTEQLFWEKRLVEAIQSAPNIPGENYKSANSVYKNISINLSKFMWYKHTQLDDITLWVIQYKPIWYDYKKDFTLDIAPEFITEWKW